MVQFATQPRSATRSRPQSVLVRSRPQSVLARWSPLACTVAFAAVLLLRAGTAPADLIRYSAYVGLTLVLPGTLVYRACRGRPHTLVEDIVMGAAVGLCLELAGWAAFSAANLRGLVWVWPAFVVAPFIVVPRLRGHWWVRGYRQVPVGWSWSVAAVVGFFLAYLAMVFLDRNPILPTSEHTMQYIDLAYQLSLAGEAKHAFPVGLPQVAGDPLHYHWFAYGHMAMSSMIGNIDLPVVALRLAVPALSAAATVLTAVVGWRISGRAWVGPVAAALFFAIGEFSFTQPVRMPFGTQATFVTWHGMSMIYGWVLLIAVIAPLCDIIARQSRPKPDGRETPTGDETLSDARVPVLGRQGAFILTALLLFASSGAKASSLPVVVAALAATALIILWSQRYIAWGIVAAGAVAAAAQLFATAVLYRFETYGLALGPLEGLRPFWTMPDDTDQWQRLLVIVAVWVAFILNMLLRTAGIIPLMWLTRRRRAEVNSPHLTRGGGTHTRGIDSPVREDNSHVRWFLLAGALAGPALYLLFSQPSSSNQYFTRSGFTFGVLASAWGYALAFERANPSVRFRRVLALGTCAYGVLLVGIQWVFAAPAPSGEPYSELLPILAWGGFIAGALVVSGSIWRISARWWPAARGKGGLVALTAVLVAGAPGLVMDEMKSIQSPNGGAYPNIMLPQSRVDAARWVRDHSDPNDILATNVHCLGATAKTCDSRSFWLSAYAERSVLVEGWAFAPRLARVGLSPFWDQEKLACNDAAFTLPTAAGLSRLHNQYGVRWLVVDRLVLRESPNLAALASLRYDNGRLAVYEITEP